MRCWTQRWLTILAGALLFALCGGAQAQATAAGHFIVVLGEVRLVGSDGAARTAIRGGEVRAGDTIATAANALAQIRLIDGGLLSVRADTEMKLDALSYAGQDDSKASMAVSLLKGGFRSITGLIGRANRDGYRVTTPSATIGIRGTDHEPFVQLPQPSGTATPVPPGTYDYVRDGQTIMRTREGLTQLIGVNQVGFIGVVPGARPQLLPTLPSIYRTETPKPAAGGAPPKPGAGAPPGESKGGDDKPAATVPGAPRQPAGEGRESPRSAPAEGPRGTPLDTPRGTPLDSPQTPAQQRGPMQQPTTPMQQGAPMQQQSTPLQQTTPMQQTTPLQQQTPLQQPTPIQQTAPVQQITPIQQTAPIQQITPIQQTAPIQSPTPIQQPAPTTIAPTIQTAPIQSPTGVTR